MPFRIGPTELIIVLVIVMIIFGVGRLPEVGRSLGKAIGEFRKSQSGKQSAIADAASDEETKKSA